MLVQHAGPSHMESLTCTSPGVLSTNVSFTNNGESDLDLEYAMNLVTSKQNVTLYQVGDLIEGLD